MLRILPYINNWFFAKQSYLETFSRNDTRVEGWFKGELLFLFDILKSQKIINSFEREFNIINKKRNQIDFRLKIDNNYDLLELKPLCISQALGTPRNLNFYFRDDCVGLIKDFKKLDLIDHNNKWIIAFVYPNPLVDLWNQVCSNIPNKFSHWRCVSNITEYPNFLFISLWNSNSK